MLSVRYSMHAKAEKERAPTDRFQPVGASSGRDDNGRKTVDRADERGNQQGHGCPRSAWRSDWRQAAVSDDDARRTQCSGLESGESTLEESEASKGPLARLLFVCAERSRAKVDRSPWHLSRGRLSGLRGRLF